MSDRDLARVYVLKWVPGEGIEAWKELTALLARVRLEEAKREWPTIPKDGKYITLLQWVQGLDLLQQERIRALEQAAGGEK